MDVYSTSFWAAGLTLGPPPTIPIGSAHDGYTYVIKYIGAFCATGGVTDDLAVQDSGGFVLWYTSQPNSTGGQFYDARDMSIVVPGGTVIGFTYGGDWFCYGGGYRLYNP